MKTLALLYCLIGLTVAPVSSLAGAVTNDYTVVKFSKAYYKLRFGYANADGWYGDDLVITNLTTSPFTLHAVRPHVGYRMKFDRERPMVFSSHPKWTATVANKTNGDEMTVSISDRIKKTYHLGTNDYFVVDIRIADQEVLLKHAKTGELTTLKGNVTNETESVEHPAAHVFPKAASGL